jgi:hypothetical protein
MNNQKPLFVVIESPVGYCNILKESDNSEVAVCYGKEAKANADLIAGALNNLVSTDESTYNDPVNTSSLWSIAVWYGSWMERIPSEEDLCNVKNFFAGEVVGGNYVYHYMNLKDLGRKASQEEIFELQYKDFLLEGSQYTCDDYPESWN